MSNELKLISGPKIYNKDQSPNSVDDVFISSRKLSNIEGIIWMNYEDKYEYVKKKSTFEEMCKFLAQYYIPITEIHGEIVVNGISYKYDLNNVHRERIEHYGQRFSFNSKENIRKYKGIYYAINVHDRLIYVDRLTMRREYFRKIPVFYKDALFPNEYDDENDDDDYIEINEDEYF